jgi:hypothetical protein
LTPDSARETRSGRFAYGVLVHGLDTVPELSLRDEEDDDSVRVRVEHRAGDLVPAQPVNRDRAVEPMGPSHQWVLDRAAGTACLVGPPLDPGLLAHPALGPVAITVNRWAGRETFHAASFAIDGLVYGVVGPRTAGKSTLVAGLSALGMTVLGDDLLVTDGHDVFSGPRCVDLRTPIPGLRLATVSARLGTRWRLALPPSPHRLPLGGWIFLRWGEEVSMRPCPTAQTLSRLAQWRGRRVLESDPATLLDIATRPAWELTRPRSWSDFESVLRLVTSTVAATTLASAR